MSDWLIRQGYGFGAAGVRLDASPHLSWGESWGLRESATRAMPQLLERRRVLSLLPAAAMGLVIAIAPLLAILHRDTDRSDIELVLLQAAPAKAPTPPVPRTPPEPPRDVPRQPAPPPPAEPPPAAEPAPAVEVAMAPPPSPAPPRARPEPHSAPAAPPRIEVAGFAAPEPPREPAATSTRVARAPVAPPAAPAFAPAVSIDAVKAAPFRTTRTAASQRPATRPSSRIPRPAPALGPVAALPAAAATGVPPKSSRRTAPRPAPAGRQVARRERPDALALPAATPAAPAVAASSSTSPERRRPTSVTAAPRAGQARPGLAGVPLASLASCVSDREEDALKQRVLASVRGRSECRSGAGRYVFVEARNLNTFLMYVERPSSRAAADRCAELTLALDCLNQARGKPTGRV